MMSLDVTWYNKSGSVESESKKVFPWAVKENVFLACFLHASSQQASLSFLSGLVAATCFHLLTLPRTKLSLLCHVSHTVTIQGPSLQILNGFMLAVSHLDKLMIGRSPLSLSPPRLAASAVVWMKITFVGNSLHLLTLQLFVTNLYFQQFLHPDTQAETCLSKIQR